MEQYANQKKFLWLLSIFILLVISTVILIAYERIIKNPIVQYVKAEKDTFHELWSYKDEYYGDSKEIKEKLANKPYESSLKLSADLDAPSDLVPAIGDMRGILSAVRLIIDTKMQPSTKESLVELDLQALGNSIMNGQIYQNEAQTSFQVPSLYEKYFLLENRNFGKFLRGNGISIFPYEEIPNIMEIQGNAITADILKEIAMDYLVFIAENYLSIDKFNVTENVKYEGNKYTKLSLTFSEEETREILLGLFNELKADKRMTILFGSSEVQNTIYDHLIKNIDSLELPTGLTYEAYMDDDYVHFRTIKFDVRNSNLDEVVTVECRFNTVMLDKDTYNLLVRMYAFTDGNEKLDVHYEEQGEPADDKYKVNRYLSATYMNGSSIKELGLNVITSYKKNKAETLFHFILNIPEVSDFPDISGHLYTTARDQGEKARRTFELGINLSMDDREVKGTLFGKNDISFEKQLEFPIVDETNSVNVFQLTKEKADVIIEEIKENFHSYFRVLEYFAAY
jgi:hypothetical protein